MLGLLVRLGAWTRLSLSHVGNLAELFWLLAKALVFLKRPNLKLLFKIILVQVRFSGMDAIFLVAVIATLIGAISIMQAFSILTSLADDMVGTFLVGVIVRELGPLVTGVVLIGRSGTAMATEIGSMRLNGEIDALLAYRVDPLAFVVLPRVLGAVLSMFVLISVFDLMGVFGGFAVSATLTDISFTLLQSRVLSALSNIDLLLFAVKAVLFGTAIAMLSCYFGLQVQRSPTELPRAVTHAVVSALTVLFIIDGILAVGVYLI
ncbi:MAG TPA: ABC transporter permease [Elusimicrobiales bacterium]|nr:ABC transporter permease [Elusimicrobiales bacterium]